MGAARPRRACGDTDKRQLNARPGRSFRIYSVPVMRRSPGAPHRAVRDDRCLGPCRPGATSTRLGRTLPLPECRRRATHRSVRRRRLRCPGRPSSTAATAVPRHPPAPTRRHRLRLPQAEASSRGSGLGRSRLPAAPTGRLEEQIALGSFGNPDRPDLAGSNAARPPGPHGPGAATSTPARPCRPPAQADPGDDGGTPNKALSIVRRRWRRQGRGLIRRVWPATNIQAALPYWSRSRSRIGGCNCARGRPKARGSFRSGRAQVSLGREHLLPFKAYAHNEEKRSCSSREAPNVRRWPTKSAKKLAPRRARDRQRSSGRPLTQPDTPPRSWHARNAGANLLILATRLQRPSARSATPSPRTGTPSGRSNRRRRRVITDGGADVEGVSWGGPAWSAGTRRRWPTTGGMNRYAPLGPGQNQQYAYMAEAAGHGPVQAQAADDGRRGSGASTP